MFVCVCGGGGGWVEVVVVVKKIGFLFYQIEKQ